MGLNVIPYPKQVKTNGTNFSFGKELTVVLDKTFTKSDNFTAEELIRDLKKEFNITAVIGKRGSYPAVVLTRQGASGKLKEQGYTIATSNEKELIISAKGEAGLFYGSQTLLQLIRQSGAGYEVPGLEITDWPDIQQRAIHYDTKHHQDKASYVKSFIKDLSRYKVNMLVWEWEDKFAYPSHPEIGAPGSIYDGRDAGIHKVCKTISYSDSSSCSGPRTCELYS